MNKPTEADSTPLFGTTSDFLETAARSPVPSASNTTTSSDAKSSAPDAANKDFFTSSVAPSVESKSNGTGSRNENSALFSLASLSNGHEDAVINKPATSDSSIIDIKSLANGKSAVDAILGDGGGIASPLAAPVLAPVPAPNVVLAKEPEAPKTNKTVLFSVLGATVIVVTGALGAVFMLKSSPSQTTVNSAAPSSASPSAESPASNNANAANNGAGAPVPEVGAAANAGAAANHGSAPSAASRGGASRSGASRSGRSASTSGATQAEAPAQQSAPAAPAQPQVSPCVRNCRGDIQCILRCASGGSATPSPSSGGSETPSRNDVLAAMNGVRSAVSACAAPLGTHGSFQMTVTFASSGRVTTANAGAPLAATPAGSCAARAVRAAQVPPFSRPTFQVVFPFSY